MDAKILGGGMKSAPVFLFNTVVDTDLGLVKYFIKKDVDFIDYALLKTLSFTDLIGLIYRRKDINPLTVLHKTDSISKEELDSIYEQYKDAPGIISESVLTDISKLVLQFNKVTDISPVILCPSDKHIDLLNNTELKEIQKVTMTNVNLSSKTEVYMKYTKDLEPFKKMKAVTFYISSCGVNLVEANDDLDMSREEVFSLVENNNRISLFDMYQMDIIGRYTHEQ